jgi:hypothetical protein
MAILNHSKSSAGVFSVSIFVQSELDYYVGSYPSYYNSKGIHSTRRTRAVRIDPRINTTTVSLTKFHIFALVESGGMVL